MENISLEALSQFYPARRWEYLTWWEQEFLKIVYQYGGFKNRHAHIDRANTLEGKYLEHVGTSPLEATMKPLRVKQDNVGNLHKGIAYTEEDLRRRMEHELWRQYGFGTRALTTCIDATPDLPEGGLLAIRIALELKEKWKKDQMKIEIFPHPVFGFKKGSGRAEVFEEAVKICDGMSLLPEKDHFELGHPRDGKLGFGGHLRFGFDCACEYGKPLQIHLDQANVPWENGTEILIEELDRGTIEVPQVEDGKYAIEVVHMISPSAYDEARFERLGEGLLRHKIRVVIAPTAGISTRQLRSVQAPLHPCLARVMELIKIGVPVCFGTDNIADMFVQANGDMLFEVAVFGLATRFALISPMAKLTAGEPLNSIEKDAIANALYQDRKAWVEVAPHGWKPAFSDMQ